MASEWSVAKITAVVACAAWYACLALSLVGRAQGRNIADLAPQPPGQAARQRGPVPYDPLELVTGTLQTIVRNLEASTDRRRGYRATPYGMTTGLLIRARWNLAFWDRQEYTVTASFTA